MKSLNLLLKNCSCGGSKGSSFQYSKTFRTLQEFDQLVKIVSVEENRMRKEGENYKYYIFDDDFFQDWYNVLYNKVTKRHIEFMNPYLNRIYDTQ